MVKHVTFDYEV